MKEIIILGTGGHAKSIADAILSAKVYKLAGFISEGSKLDTEFQYCGVKCIGCDNDLKKIFNSGITLAAIGVGYLGKGVVRNRLTELLQEIGFQLPSVVDKSAAVALNVEIGDGSFVGKNAVVNSDAIIGKMCIINSGAIVEHDCIVDDYTHIACGAVLCGGVRVGMEALVGANATIIEGCTVKSNIIIPAGSIVTRKSCITK